MSYQAIYRKWRPMVFEDIVGQSHITTTLKNQITSGRIGHAYLFCGTRGTGKTTAAKVFARAVNCLDNHEGSPCNQCEVCKSIMDGSIMDVTEIDAASNNGVDNIREIRDETKYVASKAKYRVYIIDEVHMLSSGAFNALLKTLEEPPEHVIFILATTEAHKVPQTILSRCQRFDFKRIRPEDIIVRMKEIAYGDGLNITDDGLRMIAKLADGSMRDGLSVLERVVAACGNRINADDIVKTLGIAAIDTEFSMADALLSEDGAKVFEVIAQVVEEGRDMNVFADTLIQHFRDLLVLKIAGESGGLLDYTGEDLVRLKGQAEKTTYERISYIISVLNEAKADTKWVKSPRVIYELAFTKAAMPELDDSPKAVLDRLSVVEEKIKNGITVQAQPAQVTEKADEPKKKTVNNVSKRLYNPILPEELHSENPIVILARKWDKIKAGVIKTMPYLAPVLISRDITIDADGILMLFDKDEAMYKNLAQRYKDGIRDGILKLSGVDCALKIADKEDVEDCMVDYWALKPPSKECSGQSDDGETIDPIERLEQEFPEIIEFTDDSEFLNYNVEEEHFEQSNIDDIEDEQEEFLEDNEMQKE